MQSIPLAILARERAWLLADLEEASPARREPPRARFKVVSPERAARARLCAVATDDLRHPRLRPLLAALDRALGADRVILEYVQPVLASEPDAVGPRPGERSGALS